MIVKHIMTANQHLIVKRQGGYRKWIAFIISAKFPGATPDWRIAGESVKARIIRSDWVAQCPDCDGGQIIEPGDPFICVTCQNVKNGGKARTIEMPPNREAIEKVLLRRINPRTRNWKDGECVQGLLIENIQHPGGII